MAFEAMLSALESQRGVFALDSERASGFKYSSRAYLVQVSRGHSPLFLIDTGALNNETEPVLFERFAEILGQEAWILHAATQDLPCLTELGLNPPALFDTELAGRLAGLSRVGLGSMCEALLGIRLAKEHSAVDWSIRPMKPEWLTYAALDIEVLPALMDKIEALLREQDKLEFAKQEFSALVNFRPKPPRVDRWRGVSGTHDLKDRQKLAIVRELWTARENLGQKLDVSPGRLIPDAAIHAVAKTTPKSRSELAGRKDFNGRASRTYLDSWWQAIEKGANTLDLPPLKLPNHGIPNHKNWAQKFPDADARLSAVKPVVQKLSESLSIPVENLLTPDYLRQLAWQPPEALTSDSVAEALMASGARKWQVDLLAEDLVQALTSVGPSAE